jgi:hypothetical protein
MENLLDKIAHLEESHDRIDPGLVKRKNIKLGLRNIDGTGVAVGITSKGQVLGYEKDESGTVRAVPGKLFYCGHDLELLVRHADEEERYGFEEVAYLLLTGQLPRAATLRGSPMNSPPGGPSLTRRKRSSSSTPKTTTRCALCIRRFHLSTSSTRTRDRRTSGT